MTVRVGMRDYIRRAPRNTITKDNEGNPRVKPDAFDGTAEDEGWSLNVFSGDCWDLGCVPELSASEIERYRNENIKETKNAGIRFKPGLLKFSDNAITELHPVVHRRVDGHYLGERHCEARLMKAVFPDRGQLNPFRNRLISCVEVLALPEDC